VWIVLAALQSSGCGRKAPGPEECHALALQLELGAAARMPRHQRVRASVVSEDAILERTTECLTTPYDRELVGCVTAGASPALCVRAFEARHAPPGSTTQPR
jgi:hypothetical protein